MANTSVSYVDLDFDTLKTSLKTYLRGNNLFKDYDFEGSNINVLLDLLSYNTHKNAFYLNMVMSEAFLDSAQLRSSITSHAKELNYTPSSYRSAKATINITFEATGDSQPYTLPKGSLFSTVVKSDAYTFTMPETITVSSSTTNSTSGNLIFELETDLYEGYYVKDTYIFLETDDVQRFKITNKNVDTSSITVAVYQDGSEIPIIYTQTQTLLGVTNASNIYFLQGVGNGYYEILFGDGVLGTKPKAGSQIVIDYRLSSGTGPNGAKSFSLDFDPTAAGEMTTYTVETVNSASGGSEAQTVESIRQYAPRYFAAQQRAVASDDYSSLILSNFSGVVSDVNVYGGETVEPKQYGRVIIALKPTSGTIVSSTVKNQISNFLLKYVSLPTRVIISDPDYIYLAVTTTVQYDRTLTNKLPRELKGFIESTIADFSDLNLERFDSDFRYSRFVNAIDNTDGSITSNDTNILLIKRLTPTIGSQQSITFSFDNQLHPARFSVEAHPVITSTAFTYRDLNGNDYPNSYIRDNGAAQLIVYTTVNGTEVVLNDSLGTVNHSTGEITISKLLVSNYTNYISLYAFPINKDVIVTSNKILSIDLTDSTVNVIETLR